MLLDLRGQRAHVLPLRQCMSRLVAPQPHVPQPFIMGLLVFGGCDEAFGRFNLIHGSLAGIASSPGLWLMRRARADWLRSALCVHQGAPRRVFRSLEVVAYHLGM